MKNPIFSTYRCLIKVKRIRIIYEMESTIFVEETSVIGNIVLGHTVLFDEDKYAEYQYLGLAVGKSIVPADHLWVKGYVNNIYQVQDYEGPFFNMAAGIGPFGASASLGYNKNRKCEYCGWK